MPAGEKQTWSSTFNVKPTSFINPNCYGCNLRREIVLNSLPMPLNVTIFNLMPKHNLLVWQASA